MQRLKQGFRCSDSADTSMIAFAINSITTFFILLDFPRCFVRISMQLSILVLKGSQVETKNCDAFLSRTLNLSPLNNDYM